MAATKALHLKRKQLRQKLDELKIALSESDTSADELQLNLTIVEPLLNEYDEITLQLQTATKDEQENNQLAVDHLAFQRLYVATVAEARRKTRNVSTSTPIGMQTFEVPRIKLPELKLATFSGEYSDWTQFRDSFQSTIIDNEQLSPVQKFKYLISVLSGAAKSTIDCLEVNNENFTAAWELLAQRFDKKRATVYQHIRKILELPPLGRENAQQLRSFTDVLGQALRGLKALGRPVESWDDVLLVILTEKLDQATRRAWEAENISNEFPDVKSFQEFLQNRCSLLEAIRPQEKPSERKPIKVTSLATTTECCMCKQQHELQDCQRFVALNTNDKWSFVRKKGLCHLCLKHGHRKARCKAQKCNHCGRAHSELLHSHQKKDAVEASPRIETNEPSTSVTLTVREDNNQVLLPTALVWLIHPDGQKTACRAILDSCSQSNFITSRMLHRARLSSRPCDIKVNGIGASSKEAQGKARVTLQSRHSNNSFEAECLVLNKITGNLPSVSFRKEQLRIPKELKLADDNFHQGSEVDLLLGAGLYYQLMDGQLVRLGDRMPVLCSSELGWLVAGNITMETEDPRHVYAHCALEERMERFWQAEEFTERVLSTEDIACEEIFRATTKRTSEGRFSVNLPLKREPQALGESRETALKRLMAVERRLEKNPEVKTQYANFLKEYEELGHLREVTNLHKAATVKYYIPHHIVFKKYDTTQCRVVFDAGCRSSSGLSLNDISYTGPKLQSDLFSIVLRFRRYQYVMCCDVEKMFRGILVNEEHRSLQRILWRETPSDPVRELELNTVTYGVASSPFLSARVLREIADLNEDLFPRASSILKNDTYVDDIVTSSDSWQQLKTDLQDLKEMLKAAGFNLRKFKANNEEILRSSNILMDKSNKTLSQGGEVGARTLGIEWNSTTDTINYSMIPFHPQAQYTKRQILARICSLYDPLGIINPVIVKAKLYMQELWKLKVNWDEVVEDLTSEAVLAALRRFVSRRGIPQVIHSDNATNFIGAKRELRELGQVLQSEGCVEELRKFYTDRNITWKFIPPRSPNFGGLWESCVKSMKGHLKRVARDANLTLGEFTTLLASVEAILNSRPLTPVSSDPTDLNPLCPASFLIGRPLNALPEHDLVAVPEGQLKAFQRVQQVHQHFWKRWSREYINGLQQSNRGNREATPISVGDLVIIADSVGPPTHWPLARVTSLHPGADNIVRVATVTTSSGTYKRAITKLCRLPVQ